MPNMGQAFTATAIIIYVSESAYFYHVSHLIDKTLAMLTQKKNH